MYISDVTVPVADLEEHRRFYGEVLAVPAQTANGGASLDVRVGATRIRFQLAGPQLSGCDHFAFTVPADRFSDAKQWLQARVDLLSRGRTDEFEGPRGWNSRSVYFSGPAGSVLEFIARRDLPARSTVPFRSADLLHLSEVGIAVPDVLQAAGRAEAAGWPPFAAPPEHDFAAVGDQHGLLILVPERRAWLPTTDRPAAQRELTVEARGSDAAAFNLGRTVVHVERAVDA